MYTVIWERNQGRHPEGPARAVLSGIAPLREDADDRSMTAAPRLEAAQMIDRAAEIAEPELPTGHDRVVRQASGGKGSAIRASHRRTGMAAPRSAGVT